MHLTAFFHHLFILCCCFNSRDCSHNTHLRKPTTKDINPFIQHIRKFIDTPNDIALFDGAAVQSHFNKKDNFRLNTGDTWGAVLDNVARGKNATKVAVQIFNSVEIGDVFEIMTRSGSTVTEALDRAVNPIVLTNGGGENWGLFSTVIGTRTASWVNLTDHLLKHKADYSTVKSFLNHPKIVLVVCNAHVDPAIGSHEKIISLPIGVRKADAVLIHELLQAAHVNGTRKTKLLMINNSGWGDRATINAQIAAALNHTVTNTYSYISTTDNRPYFEEILASKFVLCPSGIGMDSFRIWESLTLGAIPVVESNAGLDRTYSNLPVLVVSNFSRVTRALLDDAYACFSAHAHQFKYSHLTTAHWLRLVHTATRTASVAHVTRNHPFRNPHCHYTDKTKREAKRNAESKLVAQ